MRLFLALLLVSLPAKGARLNPESHYRDIWCDAQNGQIEYWLADRTRVDCLTDEYAVEVDFADNWYEAVGQSQYYAHKTGKKPGIVLIMENPKDQRYLSRLLSVIVVICPRIQVWTSSP